MIHESRAIAIAGRDLLDLFIKVLEWQRPWTAIAWLLMADSRCLSTLLPIYLILYLPAIKQYLKTVSSFNGGRLELLWELNTLSGQLLTGKDYLLQGVFVEEIRLAKWIFEPESTLRLRFMVCLLFAIAFGVFKAQSLLISCVFWYIILKRHLRQLLLHTINYFKFIHLLCTPGTTAPNHLFTRQSDHMLIQIVERERYWWPHGWSSRLLHSDTLGNFTDRSGCHGYSWQTIRDLQKRGYLQVERAWKGDWQYGRGDWTPVRDGRLETRWRIWQWKLPLLNIPSDWDHIKSLYYIQ